MVRENLAVAAARATFLTFATMTMLTFRWGANENHAVAAARATILISDMFNTFML